MRNRTTAAVVLIGLGLAAMTPAQIQKSGRAYTFRIKFVNGSKIKYKVSVGNKAPGANGGLEVLYPVIQTVVGVKSKVGDLVVKSGPMTFNGRPVGSETTYRMSIDDHGKLVGGQIASNSGITAFPEKPLKPGDTWKASVPLTISGLTSGASMLTTQYKFIRMTTYQGKSVAELQLTFKAGGTTYVDGKGTAFVLAKDGIILHSTMRMSVALSSGMEPMAMNVEVARS